MPSSASQGVPKVQILPIRQVEKCEPIAFIDQLRQSISARVFTPENSVEPAHDDAISIYNFIFQYTSKSSDLKRPNID